VAGRRARLPATEIPARFAEAHPALKEIGADALLLHILDSAVGHKVDPARHAVDRAIDKRRVIAHDLPRLTVWLLSVSEIPPFPRPGQPSSGAKRPGRAKGVERAGRRRYRWRCWPSRLREVRYQLPSHHCCVAGSLWPKCTRTALLRPILARRDFFEAA
jgi:hypothetical protein